jgi:DNA-binding FrmR family transcriptional regulator
MILMIWLHIRKHCAMISTSPHGGYGGFVMSHVHQHTETKNVLNRLSRATGHLESIKKMVEEGRDCGDVLIQLAAVRSAINNVGRIILADHMEHCIADAVENGDHEALDRFNSAIAQFLK